MSINKQELVTRLRDAFDSEQLILIVLSRPLQKNPESPRKITIRPVKLKEQLQYQITSRINNQDHHANHTREETIQKLESFFPQVYGDCHLYTSEYDLTVRWQKNGSLKTKETPPSKQPKSTEHNRTKQYLIPDGTPCKFLEEIGVMTPKGKVKASKFNKFRQINRFLELVNDVLPALPKTGPLNIVDFGCGKSYLTFALHHLLTEIHQHELSLTGLDRRNDVISDCSRIAEKLNCSGLSFQCGNIEAYEQNQSPDMVVSLHACDTATDDVLAQAIHWRAKIILSVPCCQHELANLLPDDHLSALTGHGILKERYASLVTDALRAKLLEAHGYKVQVVEFIAMEHTAKNLLIRAIKQEVSEEELSKKQEEFRKFKEELGLNAEVYLEQAVE